METELGQDETPEVEVENSQEVEAEPQDSGGLNPVWDPVRDELGLQFEAIKPHLLAADKGFNEGITKANAKYAPWKQFDEQGVTPEAIQQQFQVLQRMNENPEEIYEALGKFLEENGRLPKNKAEAKQAIDDVQDEDDEFVSDESKQLSELQQRLEEQQQFFQAQFEQQQLQQLNDKAEREVAKEYSAFEAAHPELSEEDKQEIYQRHFNYAASGPQNIRSLEDVYKEFSSLVERIRKAPRPNDLAPRLPGAGGGVPTGQRKDPSEFSREESQDALAALVAQAQSNQ